MANGIINKLITRVAPPCILVAAGVELEKLFTMGKCTGATVPSFAMQGFGKFGELHGNPKTEVPRNSLETCQFSVQKQYLLVIKHGI